MRLDPVFEGEREFARWVRVVLVKGCRVSVEAVVEL